MPCFPRLYAAASLKPGFGLGSLRRARRFSAALCRGLIEANLYDTMTIDRRAFSAALCRGLIEATCASPTRGRVALRFPRLYAAASLKQHDRGAAGLRDVRFPRLYAAASLKRSTARRLGARCRRFSAALCRGLIEATRSRCCGTSRRSFSAALCRGLIEALHCSQAWRALPPVFRGFMPRPH